jgi:hypothetical protein
LWRPIFDRIINIARQGFENRIVSMTDGQPASDRRFPLAWLFELAFFLLLAIASTWPLASRIQTAIPTGQERAATVPLFNLWTIWWNTDRAEVLFDDYWDAPIFAPAENAFALSEAQPVTAITTPVVWASGSLALAYNVYLLGVLAANGWCGSLLIRSLTGNGIAGLWCGAALLLLPFVHWQLGVLQLTSLSGMLLTLHFLIQFLANLRFRDALLTGASIGFCYLSCNYYGYQLCLVLLLSSPALLLQRCSVRRLAVGSAAIIAVASVIVLPVMQMQLSMSDEQTWNRKLDTVWRLSASSSSYLQTPWRGPLVNGFGNKSKFPLSPGLGCLILAAMGAMAGFQNRNTRRLTVFFVLLTMAGGLLSLGSRWIVLGQVPFQYLADWLPGLSSMRSPHRFAVLVQIGCVVLAGFTFARRKSAIQTDDSSGADNVVASPAERPSPATKRQQAVAWLHVALLCGVLAESWPVAPKLFVLPNYAKHQSWIEWLSTETDQNDIVANLPFPTGKTVSNYEATTIGMLWATHHRRRLANGYSGFFPAEFLRLKRDVQRFPDSKSLRGLQKAGVRWCVTDMNGMAPSNVKTLANQSLLSLRFETEDGRIRIYEIGRPEE